MAGFGARLKHAWNAFAQLNNNTSQEQEFFANTPVSYGSRPDRPRTRFSNERSIISSIYTRISIDAAQNDIRHVRLDDDNRYKEDIVSGLNDCLTVEANIDQAPRSFKQDIIMSTLDKGVCAIVPVDTTISPTETGSFDINTLRVGEITGWYPKHVKVNLWNEQFQRRDEIVLEKKFVAIVENPLYSVMNEPNSTLQRLIRKLNLLDTVDEQSSSGKLDLIVQLPYVIKSEARREQAEQRRKDIEFQLKGSQYGIAYTDGTEKITQLNRPAENNLLAQVEYLTKMLYGQLGLTEEVMNGTADEAAMINYNNRTIEPLMTAIVEAMRRTFLTKTGRTQKQDIQFFHDPFKLVPLSQIADIADKFSRNKIMTANELRTVVGLKPAKDAGANKLQNANMPTAPSPNANPATNVVPMVPPKGNVPQNGGPTPSPQMMKGVSQNGS